MSDAELLGRGRRTPLKTDRYIKYKEDLDKTKQTSETLQALDEEDEEEDGEEEEEGEVDEPDSNDEADNEELVAPVKPKKSKATDTKGKGRKMLSSDEEDMDVDPVSDPVEVVGDTQRRMMLIGMIHGRDSTPLNKLQLFGLDKLEELWASAASAAPSKSTKKGSKAPPKKAAKVSSSVPHKTPNKKLTSSKVVPNKAILWGSPHHILLMAQEQSARAAQPSPISKKRARDESTEQEADARCPRVEIIKHPPPRLPPLQPAQRMKSVASASSSRAGSVAPVQTKSAASVPPSQVPSRAGSLVPVQGPAHADHMDLDNPSAFEEARFEGDADLDVKPTTSASKEVKARPTKGKYKGTQEGVILSIASPLIWIGLVPNMCPRSEEYQALIRTIWEKAVAQCGLDVNEWQFTQDNNTLLRGLTSSNRSHGRKAVSEALIDHFDLKVSPSCSIEVVKARAAELLPSEFHCDETVKGQKAGLYRSSYVSRAVGAFWFRGETSIGQRYPKTFKPAPVEAIAFVCALSEELLEILQRDGIIKSEKKAKKGEGQGRKKAADKSKDEVVPHARQDIVKGLIPKHLEGLAHFQKTLPGKYNKFLKKIWKDASKWEGITVLSDDSDDNSSPGNTGPVNADDFDDEVDDSDSDDSDDTDSSSDTDDSGCPPKPTGTQHPKHHPKPTLKPLHEPSSTFHSESVPDLTALPSAQPIPQPVPKSGKPPPKPRREVTPDSSDLSDALPEPELEHNAVSREVRQLAPSNQPDSELEAHNKSTSIDASGKAIDSSAAGKDDGDEGDEDVEPEGDSAVGANEDVAKEVEEGVLVGGVEDAWKTVGEGAMVGVQGSDVDKGDEGDALNGNVKPVGQPKGSRKSGGKLLPSAPPEPPQRQTRSSAKASDSTATNTSPPTGSQPGQNDEKMLAVLAKLKADQEAKAKRAAERKAEQKRAEKEQKAADKAAKLQEADAKGDGVGGAKPKRKKRRG